MSTVHVVHTEVFKNVIKTKHK